MQTIINLVPSDAAKLIQDQLLNIATTAASKVGLGLLVALFFSIYGAMRASSAIVQALNVIYEEEDEREHLVALYWLVSEDHGRCGLRPACIGLLAAALFGYLQTAAGVLGEVGVSF